MDNRIEIDFLHKHGESVSLGKMKECENLIGLSFQGSQHLYVSAKTLLRNSPVEFIHEIVDIDGIMPLSERSLMTVISYQLLRGPQGSKRYDSPRALAFYSDSLITGERTFIGNKAVLVERIGSLACDQQFEVVDLRGQYNDLLERLKKFPDFVSKGKQVRTIQTDLL